MTQEVTRSTNEKSPGLMGIMDTLRNYAGLVFNELKFRNGRRLELKGIIIDDRNTAYEAIVSEFLTERLSERGSNPNNLSMWFSELCVPQFYDATTVFPFNYLSEKDPRNNYMKNENNLIILRYRVWEKISDNIPTLHRAHIIDIRRRFFDVPLDSR